VYNLPCHLCRTTGTIPSKLFLCGFPPAEDCNVELTCQPLVSACAPCAVNLDPKHRCPKWDIAKLLGSGLGFTCCGRAAWAPWWCRRLACPCRRLACVACPFRRLACPRRRRCVPMSPVVCAYVARVAVCSHMVPVLPCSAHPCCHVVPRSRVAMQCPPVLLECARGHTSATRGHTQATTGTHATRGTLTQHGAHSRNTGGLHDNTGSGHI
jgi:hypothetical protein